MPDFTATRSFLYVAGNVISPTQNTTNETGIYNPHNLAFNGSSGHGHSGSTGDGPRIPQTSPLSRLVTGATGALAATDVYLLSNHTAARTITFTQTAANDFSRDVTVYDYSNNAGLYPITITFAGGWTLNSFTGPTSVTMNEDNGSITLHWDTYFWHVIGG